MLTIAAFGRRVVEQVRARVVRLDRRRVDDRGTGRHVRESRLRQPHECEQVRAVRALHLLGREALDALRQRHLIRGVVDEDVESAQLVDGALDERLAVRLVLDVARSGDDLPARLLHPLGGLLRVLLLVRQIRDQDVGPSRAKAIATARPMPESPPVISALFPVRRPLPRYVSSP
jgi:hypothetical protein